MYDPYYNKYMNFYTRNPDPILIDQGQLQIGVFVENENSQISTIQSMPVDNATIQITPKGEHDNILDQELTDSSGQSLNINLAAPSLALSMNPEQTDKPFSEYDVIVNAPNFHPTIIEGVQIFPHSFAKQNIFLEPIENTPDSTNIISIKEPTLWGNFPPKIPEDDVKPLSNASGLVVLPEPVIPEYIIVHDGAPTNSSAPDYWIPFKDYIKNVASCEIYSNWPEETIKSNILAIISFTLNRVYTEWYRGKGYDFTITSSTAFDHAFSYGRNIFNEISVIVDNIFNTYITRPGIRQPLFSQYCDGQRVSCPGWMTQWGSKNLGDQGYNAIDILKNFYGQDIYLMNAEKVSGVPSSFPGINLQTGSTGPAVRTIQEQLNAISNNYPLINKIRVDGVFGPETRSAVETFQSIFNLPTTGIVDFATWYRISDIYVAITKISELQ